MIDSSSKSLKVGLLHNANHFPLIPLAHLVNPKDFSYVKMVLQLLKYEKFAWEFIDDFKIVAFLVDLQGGFTKFS